MDELNLLSAADVQQTFANFIQDKRKALKLSRTALAEKSSVPAATIKKFETTGQIALRQFLLLWQSIDDQQRLQQLTKEGSQSHLQPSSIEEGLKQ